MHAGAVAIAHKNISTGSFFKHIGKIFAAHDQRGKITIPSDLRGGLGGEFGFRFMINRGRVALYIGDMGHAAEDGCGMCANVMNAVAPQGSHFRGQSAHSAAQCD